MCNAPARRETRPFCSRRCADADLGRWLTGAYRVPTDERPACGAEAPSARRRPGDLGGEPSDDTDYPNDNG